MGELTVRMNFGDRPPHRGVLEVAVAGSGDLDDPGRFRSTALQAIEQRQPQILLINLSGYRRPFDAVMLGALVQSYVAMGKLGPGRRYALVADGLQLEKLQEILRVTKLATVLGPAFLDVETAVAQAVAVVEAPPAPLPAESSPPARAPAPVFAGPPGAWFPDLEPSNTYMFAEVATVSLAGIFVAMIGAALWRPLIWLWLIPLAVLVLYFGHEGLRAVRNHTKRVRWSRSFDGRLSARRAEAMLKEDPQRYFAHSKRYGGFDTRTLNPATLIEDRQTGKLWAVSD